MAKTLFYVHVVDSDTLHFSCESYGSNLNYLHKKMQFFCFINNRLVTCTPLKKALEVCYEALLPKGCKPWIYLSLKFRPEHLDVNIHPSKKEVKFWKESEVIDKIVSKFQESLSVANHTKTFLTQVNLYNMIRGISKCQYYILILTRSY